MLEAPTTHTPLEKPHRHLDTGFSGCNIVDNVSTSKFCYLTNVQLGGEEVKKKKKKKKKEGRKRERTERRTKEKNDSMQGTTNDQGMRAKLTREKCGK